MTKMWSTQDKRRPGAYVNFDSEPQPRKVIIGRGTPALMLAGKVWGKAGFLTVTANTDFLSVLGQPLVDILPLREALKASDKVVVYSPQTQGGAKATVTDESFTATAKHEGTAGNQLTVVVIKNTDGSLNYTTVFRNKTVDVQRVESGQLPQSNLYVDFSGTAPTGNKTLTLANGVDGTVQNTEVQAFLNGLDTQNFSVLALGTDEETTKALVVEKVKEWRSFGRGVVAVLNDYAKADYEGIISLANGLTLSDGTKLTAKEAVYYIAGASASAGTNALTYHVYEDAIDCERKSDGETIKLLNAGNMLFTYRNGKVLIEQDINTLTTLTDDKGIDFTKNKLIRTMDAINTSVQNIFAEQFIGKMANDLDGREVFKQHVITEVLDKLVEQRAIEYTVEELTVEPGKSKESILVGLVIKLTDAMEKLYMTVTCK